MVFRILGNQGILTSLENQVNKKEISWGCQMRAFLLSRGRMTAVAKARRGQGSSCTTKDARWCLKDSSTHQCVLFSQSRGFPASEALCGETDIENSNPTRIVLSFFQLSCG